MVETNDATTTALVTGASSGIGRELALGCAREGFGVLLVARSAERLESLAREIRERHGVAARAIPADLARPEAPVRIAEDVRRAGERVDVLVNNAGFGTFGPFVETDLATQLEMIQVNVTALTHLTGLFLRPMLERGRGRVLNVASTAAFQPGPLMAVYYATKAYVLSFSEALAEELRGTGVTVTTLCPGPTASRFQTRAHMEDSGLLRLGLMEARRVAEEGIRGMLEGKAIVIPGVRNKLLAQSVRVSPRFLVRRIVKELQEERSP